MRVNLIFRILVVLAVWLALPPQGAEANYFRQTQSEIDPSYFRIEESRFLGTRADRDWTFVDEKGQPFTMGDKLGKPLVLVFSYYTCDGSCSAVNQDLRALLAEVEGMELGRDYRVVTLSFDRNDTLETLAAFRANLNLPPAWQAGWTMGLIPDEGMIWEVPGKFGFKFFWQAQDRTFYHPNVYILLSPEGRVTRYLYALTNDARDIQVALMEAGADQIRPSQVIDFAVSLCYSYNYKEGRYTLNIPLFVGLGSLGIGVVLLIGSVFYFRNKTKAKEEG